MPWHSHLGCGLWMFPSELTTVVPGTVSLPIPSASFLSFASKLVGFPPGIRVFRLMRPGHIPHKLRCDATPASSFFPGLNFGFEDPSLG